jgi:hypothetical protein
MLMNRAVVISLSVLICAAALACAIVFGFDLLPWTGGKVEDLDNLVARVADAAWSRHFAAGLGTQECQASIPVHIGALVLEVLERKPAPVCSRSLEPAAPLPKPLAIVDLDSKRFDSITRDLPRALIAPSLAAAATIVFTHCSKSEVGRYGYILTHVAYRRDCRLLFVGQDGSSEMQILGIMSFWAMPPGKIDRTIYFWRCRPRQAGRSDAGLYRLSVRRYEKDAAALKISGPSQRA